MRKSGIAALLLIGATLTACGGSETTTVIKEAPAPPPETVERTVEAPPAAPTAERSSSPKESPPNVLGLPLPEAQRMLKQAGYRTVAKNTDTTFGIVIPDNYTICNQGKPREEIVVVLAQKYGC